MKAIIILSSISFFINAMDNDNDEKNHFEYANEPSYITYESAQDKYSCIFHISSKAYKEKSAMTFVHKNGIPIKEINALKMLGFNKEQVVQQMEKSTPEFLQIFVKTGGPLSLSSADSASWKFHNMQFKKPQVRIIEKERINQEENGIFGPYVNTKFLRIKVDTTYSLIYSTEPEKAREICLYFYINNVTSFPDVFPYKAKLVGSYIRLRADKEVRYF